MLYENEQFSGTLSEWSSRLNASLPAAHPERWPVPDGEDTPSLITPVVPEPLPPTTDELLQYLESTRKSIEAEGITLTDGVRFSGTAANRQTLIEAVQYASQEAMAAFTAWKDSDGQYHADYPVSAVQNALSLIMARRQALIAKEADFTDQITNGLLIDYAAIDAIEWVAAL